MRIYLRHFNHNNCRMSTLWFRVSLYVRQIQRTSYVGSKFRSVRSGIQTRMVTRDDGQCTYQTLLLYSLHSFRVMTQDHSLVHERKESLSLTKRLPKNPSCEINLIIDGSQKSKLTRHHDALLYVGTPGMDGRRVPLRVLAYLNSV